MLNPQIISENIVCLRQRMGLTQQELAARANVTHQAVSKWENGSSIPDLQTLMTLSRLFGVSLDDLLTEVLAERKAPGASPVNEEDSTAAAEEKPAAADEPQPEKDVPRIDLHALAALAPFTLRDKLARLILSQIDALTPEALVPLAPFLGRRDMDEIVARMDMTGVTPNQLVALAPFISGKALSDGVSRMDSENITPNHLAALAPFLGQGALGNLIHKVGQLPMKALTMLAPFLSRETVGEQLSGIRQERDTERKRRPAEAEKPAPSANDRLALRLADEGDFGEILDLLPFLGRETVSQVVDKALDEDDLDFLMNAFDYLPGDLQRKTALHVAENGDFDEIGPFLDRLDEKTRARIVSMALDQDETDFLRGHIHTLSREVQQSVALRLADNGDFDEIMPFFPTLDEETRCTIIRMALDQDEIDCLRGHGELIPDGIKREVALRLAEEDEFRQLSRLIPLESLDEATLNRLAEQARAQDESAFLRRVNLIRGAARPEAEPDEAGEATDAALAMAAAREGDFSALPALFDRLTAEEKDEAMRLAIVYDDTDFLVDLIDDLPEKSLETLCFALARMGETARLEPFKARLSPETLARIGRILSEKE